MAPSTTRRPSWRTVTPVLALAVFGLAACSNSQESSSVKGTTPSVWTGAEHPATTSAGAPETPAGDTINVPLRDGSGAQVGTATFAKSGSHLDVTVEVKNLKPGFHGMHIHSVGKCETNSVGPNGGAPGDFLSAGGHLQTGDPNAKPASGDLVSIAVRSDGTGRVETTTDSVTLDDIKGKALIIHANADDFGNIPTRYTQPGGATGPDAESMSTGDAGPRVACGVIG